MVSAHALDLGPERREFEARPSAHSSWARYKDTKRNLMLIVNFTANSKDNYT